MDDEQAPSVPVDCEGPRRGFFLQKRSKLEGKKTKYIHSSSVKYNWQIQENVESWTIKFRANINASQVYSMYMCVCQITKCYMYMQYWYLDENNLPLKDDCEAGDFLPDFPPSYSGSRYTMWGSLTYVHPLCTETFEHAEEFVSHENNKHRAGYIHKVCANASSYKPCHSFVMWFRQRK